MEKIFHEKQEGALCAQHCLNSLLQGPYFDAVSLSEIGHDLDEAEREAMAMGNVNSPEYLDFLQQPSSNYDDSGYFSVQVICKALEFWGLQMIPYNSQSASTTRSNPLAEKAYICNHSNHWLTIRRFGRQWFNLNSTKMCPELVSDTYLSLLIAQLQQEGYSIFVIRGFIQDSEADTYFQGHSLTQAEFRDFSDKIRNKSKNPNPNNKSSTEIPVDATPPKPVDAEDVRNKRMSYFLKKGLSENLVTKEEEAKASGNVAVGSSTSEELTEEEMLRIAMQISMEKG